MYLKKWKGYRTPRPYLEFYKNRYTLERMIGDTNIDEETTKYLNAAYVSGKVIDSVKSNRNNATCD